MSDRPPIRLGWGRDGARDAAARGGILVVVDVLCFSTAAITAVQHGGVLYPSARGEDAASLARWVEAEVAVGREEVPGKGRYSLSPLTYAGLERGTRVVLPSPNGATCSRYGASVPYLLVGALVNAGAVARAVNYLQAATALPVTVVACGERWPEPGEDGALRFAIEDYLGAGALLSRLSGELSPEARVCAGAFLHAAPDLDTLLWECESGRELRERGYGEDVRHAAALDRYDTVPVMREGALVPLSTAP